jgi:hypothetical protein
MLSMRRLLSAKVNVRAISLINLLLCGMMLFVVLFHKLEHLSPSSVVAFKGSSIWSCSFADQPTHGGIGSSFSSSGGDRDGHSSLSEPMETTKLLLHAKSLEKGVHLVPPSIQTRFIAHAPGYSVISNAYIRNGRWYFITTEPWSFPSLDLVLTSGPGFEDSAAPTSTFAQVISPEEAWELGITPEAVEFEDSHTVSYLLRARIVFSDGCR